MPVTAVYITPAVPTVSIRSPRQPDRLTDRAAITVGSTTSSALTGLPLNISAIQNQQFTGAVATFTDSYTNVKDYRDTINWGDGSSSPGVIFAKRLNLDNYWNAYLHSVRTLPALRGYLGHWQQSDHGKSHSGSVARFERRDWIDRPSYDRDHVRHDRTSWVDAPAPRTRVMKLIALRMG